MKNSINYQKEIDTIRFALDYEIIALALVEPAENQYVLKWQYASGNLNDRLKKVILYSGKGIPGTVFKTGKPLFIPDVCKFAEKGELFNYPILGFENLKSIGAVPLWHSGRVAGVLLGGFREAHLMTEEKMKELIEISGKGLGNLDGKELMLN